MLLTRETCCEPLITVTESGTTGNTGPFLLETVLVNAHVLYCESQEKNSKVAVWETSDPTTLHITKTLTRKRCWPYLDSDESMPRSKNKEEVFCAKWHSTLKQGGHRPEFILQSGRCELCPQEKRNTSRISCATCAKFTRRNEPLHLRSHVWTSAWHSEVQWKASYYSASLMESPGRQVWR